MRRGIVFAAAIVVAFAAVSPDGLARMSHRDVIAVCDVTEVDIYFWPEGHDPHAHAGNPLATTLLPHAEFSRAANPTVQLGYMETRQNLISTDWCGEPEPGTTVPFHGGVTPQTTGQTQKLSCSFEGKLALRIAPFTKVRKRTVTRLVKIKGKRRKVRRTITQTTRIGNRASISTPEDHGALAVITLSSDLATPSLLKWDPRACKPLA
jgi:hypothetical protein